MARTYEEMTAAIGNVVLQFAQIEAMMGMLVAVQYASREATYTFVADVLGDEGFSYGLRCNVVRKVLIRKGMTEGEASKAIQPLRDLGGTRNLIAHAGKLGLSEDGQRAGYFHPKKVGEVINDGDLEILCKRFEEQRADAWALLIPLAVKHSLFQQVMRGEVEEAAAIEPKPDEG